MHNFYYCLGGCILIRRFDKFSFKMISRSPQLIHEEILISSSSLLFLTYVYAFNDTQEKIPHWRSLKEISSSMNEPWFILGYFNIVLTGNEKFEGNPIFFVSNFRF